MLGDTIFAIASPPGAADRGVIRVSGPDALSAVGELLDRPLTPRRGVYEHTVEVLGFPVGVALLVMPGPGSYTGEDVVELHLPGGPLLLEEVQAGLRRRARDATPGEFTRRAHEAGRLDLPAAEAVLELIHAAGAEAGRRAIEAVRGGLSRRVDEARGRLQDVHALLEAGLDFTEGETGEVDPREWLPPLQEVADALAELRAGWPAVAPAGEVLLVGAANAGKSSLCNALAGSPRMLVADAAGTTRDVLAVEVAPGVCLLDAPGELMAPGPEDAAALALRDHVAGRGAGALAVVDLTAPVAPRTELPVLAVVLTKVDLAPDAEPRLALPAAPRFRVSSTTGEGVDRLREFLRRLPRAAPGGGGRRVADLLDGALAAVARAVAAARRGGAEELVAADLLEALARLDEVHGRSTAEDVLDRIFGRFCLGK